jgi:ectoine hydroxylase-related dioxygenase (phytanoyl-CoA dioxygenase family)
VPAHADYVAVPDPYPEFALVGVAVWALDDWTVEAGPTWIIPGSQTRRRAPRAGDNLEGGVPILMPKGSVTFFTEGVWHWQGDRTAPGDRVSLHNTYQRPFMRQADDFSNIDAVLHRNSPVLSGLTGHDDYFGRSDYTGHDFKRSGYMSRRQAWGARFAVEPETA